MVTVLVPAMTRLAACTNEQVGRLDVCNFLVEVLGYTVTVEQPWQRLSWLDYDAVFMTYSVYNGTEICDHVVAQLRQSIAAGQPRLTFWDDEYFTPLSLLKQLGLPDTNEFTHVLMLNPQLKPSPQLHKYARFSSSSVSQAKVLVAPIWCCPRQLHSLHVSDVTKLELKALYAGHLKPDRLRLNSYDSIAFCKTTYLDYLHKCSQHLASVMMNSASHDYQPTPRFCETSYLTAQVWPSDVSVKYFKPNLVFSSDAELSHILKELSKQTPAERHALIVEQQRSVADTLICNIENFLSTYSGGWL